MLDDLYGSGRSVDPKGLSWPNGQNRIGELKDMNMSGPDEPNESVEPNGPKKSGEPDDLNGPNDPMTRTGRARQPVWTGQA